MRTRRAGPVRVTKALAKLLENHACDGAFSIDLRELDRLQGLLGFTPPNDLVAAFAVGVIEPEEVEVATKIWQESVEELPEPPATSSVLAKGIDWRSPGAFLLRSDKSTSQTTYVEQVEVSEGGLETTIPVCTFTKWLRQVAPPDKSFEPVGLTVEIAERSIGNVSHKKFGAGKLLEELGDRVRVRFGDKERILKSDFVKFEGRRQSVSPPWERRRAIKLFDRTQQMEPELAVDWICGWTGDMRYKWIAGNMAFISLVATDECPWMNEDENGKESVVVLGPYLAEFIDEAIETSDRDVPVKELRQRAKALTALCKQRAPTADELFDFVSSFTLDELKLRGW